MVTPADVEAVYESGRDAVALQPFIAAAQEFVDAHLTDKGLRQELLDQIQIYVAAHLLYVSDAGIHDALSVEDVRERFTEHWRQPGLLDSRFGRTAVMLDPTGTLAKVSRLEAPAEIRLIGARCD